MIQQTVSLPSWSALVVKAPGLQRFAEEAIEAARNRAWWWPSWFPHYAGFNCLFAFADVAGRRAAADYLVSVFRAEWRRRWATKAPR